MRATTRQDTCESRVHSSLQQRLNDLDRLWHAYCNAGEPEPDGETFTEYGLAFDYVAPNTFGDQPEGFFRYQLSWGGPGDEFRFFVNPDLTCHHIEYWYLDWFDGAHRVLDGDGRHLLMTIWEWFREVGSVDAALEDANQ